MAILEISSGGRQKGDPHVQADVPAEMFGENILAHRNTLDPEVNYDGLVADLGVDKMRFPGGSLTEEYFEIENPDNDWVTGRETGESLEFIKRSDFMELAAEEDRGVYLVLPTRNLLTEETDENGERYADIDEEALRTFVHDTADQSTHTRHRHPIGKTAE